MSDAALAATLLAVDPAGLGGAVLRGPPSSQRDAWLSHLRALLPAEAPMRRAPAHIDDDRLLGGLDLPASLAAGRPVAQRGLLAEADGGVIVVAMAERLSEGAAARIGAVLDDGVVSLARDGIAATTPARIGVVLLDEGATPEEHAPAALAERCAFVVDGGDDAPATTRTDVDAARKALPNVAAPDPVLIEALCETAMALGVASLRAPVFALRAARALAALDGRAMVSIDDIATAARLVLAPRATQAPADEAPQEPAPEQSEAREEQSVDTTPAETPPTDLVLAAVRAVLPADAIAALADNTNNRGRARGGGSGARAVSPRRGRPVGVRAGAPRSGERLALVETLRAAAPWQKLRGAAPGRVAVRRDDFRVRGFAEQRESTTVFVVDASGSAVFQRLAEAKGAVELLLAEAYVSRAHVALVTFRNAGADVLLPPTRSLARARKRLAELAGGGATPLAHGLEAALLVAKAEASKGRTPRILLLSDGRANIARNGEAGRAQAEEDAMGVARVVRAAGIAAIHIDTSARPAADGDRLARAMGARYAPLPYVEAHAVSALARAS
jgi:magnesium chelatase subunit D